MADKGTGRQTTGALKAVNQEQYSKERNIVNQSPHYEPVTDDYPGYNQPLKKQDNQTITDSFFDLDKNKSVFNYDGSMLANPFVNAQVKPMNNFSTHQVTETVTTTTKNQKMTPQTQPDNNQLLKGLENPDQGYFQSPGMKGFSNPLPNVSIYLILDSQYYA